MRTLGLFTALTCWRLRELALPQGQCATVSSVTRGFASLSLVSLNRFAARRDRDPGRDALLAVASVVHGGVLARLQLRGCSPLAVFDKLRRSVPREGRCPLQVFVLERELLFCGLTISTMPRSVIVFAGGPAMAPSGNAAPMASAATVFMSVDAFILCFFRAPRLLGTVLAAPLASPVPLSVCEG